MHAGQHAPYLLANGHILLFDNGPHRLNQSGGAGEAATDLVIEPYLVVPLQRFAGAYDTAGCAANSGSIARRTGKT